MNMKVTYDPDVDAMYIMLTDAPSARQTQVEPGVIHDFDRQDQLIGVEVLHVRKKLQAGQKPWQLDIPFAKAG